MPHVFCLHPQVGSEEDLQAIFDKHAGKKGGADAKGLRNILRTLYKKGDY